MDGKLARVLEDRQGIGCLANPQQPECRLPVIDLNPRVGVPLRAAA